MENIQRLTRDVFVAFDTFNLENDNSDNDDTHKRNETMTTHRFILEPYKGIATRHTCPACQRKRCFSRYVDTEKRISFPDHVGRCDHEQKCGYHFTPRNYFEETPDAKQQLFEKGSLPVRSHEIKTVPTSFIDEGIVKRSLKCYETNKLYQFLASQFGKASAMSLMKKYRVGSSRHWEGATVFWQIDRNKRVRTGKIMLYNSDTGKRIKEPYNHITWVHTLLHKSGFNMKQCFFGEHLLATDKTCPVALVESEKTALIASYYLPQYLWLASGGKNGCFNESSLSALAKRSVVLFPDLGATDYWQSKIGMIRNYGIEVQLFDYLENNAPESERKEGYDIADYLLQIQPDEAVLQAMNRKNPHLKTLIEMLGLELVNVQRNSS